MANKKTPSAGFVPDSGFNKILEGMSLQERERRLEQTGGRRVLYDLDVKYGRLDEQLRAFALAMGEDGTPVMLNSKNWGAVKVFLKALGNK